MQSEFQLHHPAGINISRLLTPAMLYRSIPAQDLTHQDMGNDWVWIRLPTFPDGDVIVGCSLGFNQDRLEQIQFADANSKYGTDWNDWSEKQERLRAQKSGLWLAGKGYPVGSYPWGTVWAAYDAKGGFGSAGVRFAA